MYWYWRQWRGQSVNWQQKKLKAQKALEQLKQWQIVKVKQKKFKLVIVDLNSWTPFTESEFIQEFM